MTLIGNKVIVDAISEVSQRKWRRVLQGEEKGLEDRGTQGIKLRDDRGRDCGDASISQGTLQTAGHTRWRTHKEVFCLRAHVENTILPRLLLSRTET